MSAFDFAKAVTLQLREIAASRPRRLRHLCLLAGGVLTIYGAPSSLAEANCTPWQLNCNGTAMNGGTIDGHGNTWTSNLNGGYTDQSGRTWTKGVNDDWKRSDGYSVHRNMGGGYTDSKGENFSQGMSTGWVGDRGTNCAQQVSGTWLCN
jgi:hypothetical protein